MLGYKVGRRSLRACGWLARKTGELRSRVPKESKVLFRGESCQVKSWRS